MRKPRLGMAVTWLLAAMTAIIAIISLAVDFGHVQMVKTELRRAADAAARAGVSYLGDYSSAQSQAITLAGLNAADGQSVVLQGDPSDDIEFGTWDDIGRVFSKRTGTDRANANAIRINARRIAANNNAVQLGFSSLLGVKTCDVKASSVACTAPLDFVIVGLNYVYMAGNSTDSYWPNMPGVVGNAGNIGSNGDITCKGTSYIHGNAHPGIGHTVIGASNVVGSTTPLNYTLSYPNGNPSPYSNSNNDNNLIPKGCYSSSTRSLSTGAKNFNVPAGHYVLKDLSVGSSGSLTLTGAAVFYVYGTVDIKGTINTYQNLPQNFRLIMIPDPSTSAAPGAVKLASGGTMTALIYAPQSPITFSASFEFYGQVVGLTIDMTGGSNVHYDASQAKNGGISIVQ